MFNKSGISSVTGAAPVQILANVEFQYSVGIVVAQGSTEEDSNGKKIIKAGTPLTGSLDARGTAFTAAGTESVVIGQTDEDTPVDVKVDKSNAIGVLLHDVDVTAGSANGTLLLAGVVNTNRIDTTTRALITDGVKEALGKIIFMAC